MYLKPSQHRLRGKVAILTGASRGIGYSIAEVFAHEGAQVVICDIDPDSTATAVANIKANGGLAEGFVTDLLKEEAASKLISLVMAKFSRLDILVNNARTGRRSDVATQDMKSWDNEVDLMLKSCFVLSRLAVDGMKKNLSGAILNVSSVAASLTVPESPAYHAAKGGLEALSRYLATQVGEFGVRVNAICPGHVFKSEQFNQTPAWKPFLEKLIPLKRVPTSVEIGYAALFLCGDESSAITGQTLVVDGGLSLIEQANIIRIAGLDATGPSVKG